MAQILALNAYDSGSHQSVLAEWCDRSAHAIDICPLPGRHWKWRMRHAAQTFAEISTDKQADCIWCTDMLDVAAWRGLAPKHLRDLPHVLYMHENQLFYPDQHKQDRDFHYAFTNFTSACAADLVVWNSAWHRDQFIDDMRDYLKRMPDYRLNVEQLHEKSVVLYPGMIFPDELAQRTANSVPHLLWAARWEWEKGPDIFFDALADVGEDLQFSISVIGGDAKKADHLFQRFEQAWQHRIKHWGYVENRQAYFEVLQEADFIISTARHEFFGLSMVEACAAGCRPILPQRLAYPEVFAHHDDALFYAGDAASLATCLRKAIADWKKDEALVQRCHEAMQVYSWQQLCPAWDAAIDKLLA